MPLYEVLTRTQLKDLSLDKVENTTDLEKPISYAVQAALDQIIAGQFQPPRVTRVTADYTATTEDDVILADISSNPIDIVLPSNSWNGKIFRVKRVGSGQNSLKVKSTNKTIDGSVEYPILYANQSYSMICFETNYFII